MARIVSKLNLNKTPQLVESNSMIFAKNIKLLKDGSIGQDDSILPINLSNYTLSRDISAIITNLNEKIDYWKRKVEELEESSISADIVGIYKTYITENLFVDSGLSGIVSAYQYYGGNAGNPIFVLDNGNLTTQINHSGNTILLEDGTVINPVTQTIDFGAIGYFNNLNNTSHTRLGFPLAPPEFFKHYGDIIYGPSRTYYDNFDYTRYFEAISSLADSDPQWYNNYIEKYPDTYPDDYPVEYNGSVYHIQPLYGWMMSWFLIQHGQKIQTLIDEALHNAAVDDNVIESQIKLLRSYIDKAKEERTYYTNCLNNIGNIQDYTIVGIIPYNTEFYLFLYNEGHSIILKYDETTGFSICNCNWNYSGGIIDGNCVVNLNGDILLNIIEYKEDNTLLVPIKTINLTESSVSDDESIYTQVPKINLFNLDFVEYYNNNIPTGTYQFFIRYEIRDNFYTSWFPASKELFAGTRKASRTQQGNLQYIDDSIDSGSSFHFQVNKLLYNADLNFKSFQIGFILAHDDTVVARAWKKFDLDITDIYFDYSKEYIEEIDVEDLLNTPYGVFNVKNVTNFKNKLYISNYIESDFNPELQDYLSNVSVEVHNKSKNVQGDTYYNYPITVSTVADNKYITSIDNVSIEDIVANLISQAKSYVDLGNYNSRSYTYKGVTLTINKISDDADVDHQSWTYSFIYTINNDSIDSSDYSNIVYFISTNNTCFGTNGRFYISVPNDPGTNYLAVKTLKKTNHTRIITYTLNFSVSLSNIHFNEEIAKVETTLMPGQKYDYYIHFVKETGEYTNGYKFASSYIDISKANSQKSNINVLGSIDVNQAINDHDIFYPVFSFDETLPAGYVACFITIVHTDTNTSEVFNLRSEYGPDLQDANKKVVGDNIDLDIREYKDFDNLTYIRTGQSQYGKCNYYASQDSSNWLTFGGSGKVLAASGHTFSSNAQYFIIMNYESNSKYIRLKRITPYIIVSNSHYVYDNYESLTLYSYICNVVKLDANFINYIGGTDVYKKHSNFLTGNNTLEDLNESEFTDWLNISGSVATPTSIYSNFNLNYVTLTLDLYPRIVSKNFDSGHNSTESIQNANSTVRGLVTIFDSMNLSDIYELKSMYKDYTRKTYQPYTDKAITKFDNTVRSSMLEGDESKVNVFRFKATDYYNVPTDKGIIINMKAIGEAIIVHTEDSMFRFSGANSLTAAGGEEVAMKEGEPFDTGIQEIFGSEFGFAGLQHKEQHTITENGYTFYDADSNTIYLYGGQQQVLPLSDDISKLLNRAKIEDVSFANDYYNDRIFVQVKFIDGFFATLSFNFRVKSFISLHDFKFEKSFNTKTKCYFIKRNKIYVITKDTVRTYFDLVEQDNLYPSKDTYYFDPEEGMQFDSNDRCSIVDIIFKEEYANVKTLNAISWVCNQIEGFSSGDPLKRLFVAEENLTPYAGGFLRIYTDSTSTDLLEIWKQANPFAIHSETLEGDPPKQTELLEVNRSTVPVRQYTNPASYKYPRYNLGQWTLNYFRNILNTTDITNSRSNSDNQSLIYGKYIVVRFVFSASDNFKLEDIRFNIAPY